MTGADRARDFVLGPASLRLVLALMAAGGGGGGWLVRSANEHADEADRQISALTAEAKRCEDQRVNDIEQRILGIEQRSAR